MLSKAGDVYLFNHQCWHRGAPNVSDRTRYVMQLQYAQRWADRRFKGAG
jgi:ectoine hydroxylase-related dioxygenase (phytanoyl-CoA dioxygenase family)